VGNTGGINSEMICDLMIPSGEHRFGSLDPRSNGFSITTLAIRLKRCAILPMSWFWSVVPRLCQALKTMERLKHSSKRLKNYACIYHRPDAHTIMAKLPRWFDDYNEVHTQKKLNMLSPREPIRSYLNQLSNSA
jgi:putative transposase